MEKRLISIPSNVEIKLLDNGHIHVKGPKGTLERHFIRVDAQLTLNKKENQIEVFDYFVNRRKKAIVSTIASHIKNMILGVQNPFVYKLKIIYSHFPIDVKIVKGKGSQILEYTGMYGMKDKTRIPVPKEVKTKVQGEDIVCESIDIEKVGQFAARVEQSSRLRGKRAKDPRIFQDGIYTFERPIR